MNDEKFFLSKPLLLVHGRGKVVLSGGLVISFLVNNIAKHSVDYLEPVCRDQEQLSN